MAKIRAKFEPMQCLQAVPDLKVDKKDKVAHFDNKWVFDAQWTFEIVGRKFE